MSGRNGPRRKIVGEELIRPEGAEQSELYEVLECGHRQPIRCDDRGEYTADERCCKQCRDREPVGPPGVVVDEIRFD